MSRPSLDQYLMGVAQLAATRTTCIRRGVGCVLSNARGHILAVGYNGVAAGMPHCNEEVTEQLPTHEMGGGSRFAKVLIRGIRVHHPHACKGHDLPPGQDSCEAVHAEQNALLQCRDPWEIDTAYVTLSPCKACMKLLLNTSCSRLVILEKHVDELPLDLWIRAGRTWEILK